MSPFTRSPPPPDAATTPFWPRRPAYDPEFAAEDVLTRRGPWPRVARLIQRGPRLTWVIVTILLGAAALGVTQLHAQGVAQSDLILGHSDARDGQAVLGVHFPAGSGSPVYVLVDEEKHHNFGHDLVGQTWELELSA